nr:filamentous hemagglutinin N-terminal domain-containing protein [Hydrococcus sp. Prado102]
MINEQVYQFCLFCAVFINCLATTTLNQAQPIKEDGTLKTKTEVHSLNNLNFRITGGTKKGANLFHSFKEFSVPQGGSAHFDNDAKVQNIISRVTGGFESNIDGLIQANGSANLFLLNPKGIIFGRSASLDIGGSFIASTANSLVFEDGAEFSATNPQAQPLLTMSVPIGLQFGKNAGEIHNQSQEMNIRNIPGLGENRVPVGLQVEKGKTLAIVGGDVFVRGGGLTASGGRIELGSVASSSLVRFKKGWALEYESIKNLGQIELSQGAFINTGDASNGTIQLQGRRVTIDNSFMVGSPLEKPSDTSSASINIDASEYAQVSNNSEVSARTSDTRDAGNIIINTPQLIVRDGGQIIGSTQGSGQAGNITVEASKFIKVIGNLSLLSTQTFATNEDAGNAGTIEIKTGKLMLIGGGQITNSTFGAGDAGNLKVDAFSVEVNGRSTNGAFASSLFAQSSGGKATGNAGTLEINTERLIVRDGARISVGAIEETFRTSRLGASTGQGGDLIINASDFVEVAGSSLDNNDNVVPSTVLAESQGTGDAGNLTIATDRLIVRDGAAVSVSSPDAQAGDLNITANTIALNQGNLTAETGLSRGDREGANINLQGLNLLRLENDSLISATASGRANGGNINIDTRYLIALPSKGFDGNNIIANAFRGNGGNISITAQRIFGIEPRLSETPFNDITASSEFGTDGVVEINTPEFEPTREELPANLVDVSRLIEQNLCQAGRGSQFTVTGRSGLPNSPNEAFSSNETWEDWRIAESSQQPVTSQPTVNRQKTIVEAQGWVVNSQG